MKVVQLGVALLLLAGVAVRQTKPKTYPLVSTQGLKLVRVAA